MKYSSFLAKLAAWVVLLLLISTHNVHAYIDPGTGSYILQLIIAGLLGALFTATIYWRKIKAFFSNRFSKEREKEGDSK